MRRRESVPDATSARASFTFGSDGSTPFFSPLIRLDWPGCCSAFGVPSRNDRKLYMM